MGWGSGRSHHSNVTAIVPCSSGSVPGGCTWSSNWIQMFLPETASPIRKVLGSPFQRPALASVGRAGLSQRCAEGAGAGVYPSVARPGIRTGRPGRARQRQCQLCHGTAELEDLELAATGPPLRWHIQPGWHRGTRLAQGCLASCRAFPLLIRTSRPLEGAAAAGEEGTVPSTTACSLAAKRRRAARAPEGSPRGQEPLSSWGWGWDEAPLLEESHLPAPEPPPLQSPRHLRQKQDWVPTGRCAHWAVCPLGRVPTGPGRR